MNSGSSRREFIEAASKAAAGGVAGVCYLGAASTARSGLGAAFMEATPLHAPIGLQLYTVGAEMDRDPAGTLEAVAAAGYTAVELSPLSKTPAKRLKKMVDDTGLKNPSGHYVLPDLMNKLPEMIEMAKLFGQEYMIVTVPWVADPTRFKPDPAGGEFALFMAVIKGLTLDDWKWNAEQFNKVGEQVKKVGLQLGYHNHNFEWKKFDSGQGREVTGYDEFLRLTDAALVKLELDCGWATVAGQDPAAYLTRYPERYRLLHVKDFKKGFTPRTTLMEKDAGAPVPTELGRGGIDYSRVLAAAKKAEIRALFVEQEPPFTEMPALEAIKVDFEYVNGLKV
jgi:sugar phosphate isomerase/epimerase